MGRWRIVEDKKERRRIAESGIEWKRGITEPTGSFSFIRQLGGVIRMDSILLYFINNDNHY